MLGGEPGLDPRQQRPDHDLGDLGQDQARGIAVEQPEQHLQADLELARLRPVAGGLEHVLKVARAFERALELGLEPRGLGHRLQEVGRQHGLEQARVSAEVAGKARRRAHQVGDQGKQARIGAEQREQLHARRQVGHELVESGEGGIGLGLIGERAEQARDQLGQQLACPGVPGRTHVAVVPGADAGGDRRGLGKAHLGERGQRLRIVFGAGEHERPAAAEIDAALEQRGVVMLDALEPGAHGLGQRSAVRIAHERRKPLDLVRPRGQAVGLLVGDHLQPVLDPPQEAVGPDQLIGGLGLQPAGRDQGAERVAGCRHAHLGHPAAQDQLLRLDEELDLPDAAASDLDVVARHPDRAVAAVGVDLALDRMDVADRRVVQQATPQERLQIGEKAVAGDPIAGDHPRLDQRRPLPVLAVALVVLLGVLDRQRQRMAGRVRAQPEVGAEDVAVLGALLEHVDQRPRQAHGAGHRPLRDRDRRGARGRTGRSGRCRSSS